MDNSPPDNYRNKLRNRSTRATTTAKRPQRKRKNSRRYFRHETLHIFKLGSTNKSTRRVGDLFMSQPSTARQSMETEGGDITNNESVIEIDSDDDDNTNNNNNNDNNINNCDSEIDETDDDAILTPQQTPTCAKVSVIHSPVSSQTSVRDRSVNNNNTNNNNTDNNREVEVNDNIKIHSVIRINPAVNQDNQNKISSFMIRDLLRPKTGDGEMGRREVPEPSREPTGPPREPPEQPTDLSASARPSKPPIEPPRPPQEPPGPLREPSGPTSEPSGLLREPAGPPRKPPELPGPSSKLLGLLRVPPELPRQTRKPPVPPREPPKRPRELPGAPREPSGPPNELPGPSRVPPKRPRDLPGPSRALPPPPGPLNIPPQIQRSIYNRNFPITNRDLLEIKINHYNQTGNRANLRLPPQAVPQFRLPPPPPPLPLPPPPNLQPTDLTIRAIQFPMMRSRPPKVRETLPLQFVPPPVPLFQVENEHSNPIDYQQQQQPANRETAAESSPSNSTKPPRKRPNKPTKNPERKLACVYERFTGPVDRLPDCEIITCSVKGSYFDENCNFYSPYYIKRIDKRIPQGKLCYIREKHSLLRYFDDTEKYLYLQNIHNKNTNTDDPYFKRVLIPLPNDIRFSTKDELTVEEYVTEMELVKQHVPLCFYQFYEYVTGYQIVHQRLPVSFLTYLNIYNTNGLADLKRRYIRSLKTKK